ncbi:Putative amidoligase enzyme [Phaeobacter piscinae]|uniref:Amidoligase enzyme n=1 Tax=Phaeobacter piscinae TaxID=1580596 RepID=A0ABN5DHW9_9RHOB|nr:amidoligase family protein [Phaeobacter piscinae]ATG36734.1 Putative amidoligase enzyme [Phaeobacter piscinae]AUQ87255.1 Putative amidoligase enzyme [Phaeobacter piscinae]AUR25138.1 Putative amidoligase enzyme [Phaeobacter piscinae]
MGESELKGDMGCAAGGAPDVIAAPLPQEPQARRSAAARKVGVEIEFGGLSVTHAQKIVQRELGGEIRVQNRADGPNPHVKATALGDVEVYLDSRYRSKPGLGKTLVAMAEPLIPVEIVTPPLKQSQLSQLDQLCVRLAEAGATGTQDRVLNGFGVHLNVEVADMTAEHIGPVLTSFALLEPLLRRIPGIDLSRRVQPFIAPYPKALVDALCASPPQTMDDLLRLYLEHAADRNHALDLLPLLADYAPDRVRAALGEGDKTAARPAYHYRLPDCRLGDPDWSITREWNRWAEVEQIARDGRLKALIEGWQARPRSEQLMSREWAKHAADILGISGREGIA